MCLGVRFGIYIPDRTHISFIRATHGVGIVKIVLTFAQKKYVFVGTCGAVLYAFRLAVWFVPNNVRP